MKFAHTMIRIKNTEKSLAFYQDILEMKLTRTMELKTATLYFLTDKEESFALELTYNHDAPENDYEHGSYFGHLAFETANIDKITEKLHLAGMDYTRAPFLVKEGGPKIAFLEDPDGFSIEIIERK